MSGNRNRNNKSSYMFTNKKHPLKGIIATILGSISILSIVAAIVLTYQRNGKAEFNYGVAIFMTTLFSLAGIGLGIASRMERDKFYLFSYLGIGFNFLALAAISFILYAGVYGF